MQQESTCLTPSPYRSGAQVCCTRYSSFPDCKYTALVVHLHPLHAEQPCPDPVLDTPIAIAILADDDGYYAAVMALLLMMAVLCCAGVLECWSAGGHTQRMGVSSRMRQLSGAR